MPFTVTRLENNLWGYEPPPHHSEEDEDQLTQIQIATPEWKEPTLSYLLAQMVSRALSQKEVHSRKQLEDGITLSVTNNVEPLMGKWNVSLVRHDTWWDAITDFFPFKRMYRDKQIAVIQVSREPNTIFDVISRIFSDIISHLFSYIPQEVLFLINDRIDPFSTTLPLPLSEEEQLQIEPFDDPFTNLASLYLRSNSPFFVSEEEVLGAYRFVLTEDGDLTLKEITSQAPTEAEKTENRNICQLYKQFIVLEFGREKLDYISSAYGFSLDALIAAGEPLLPDHIFKTNIGMNNIELGDVQHFYEKLLILKQRCDQAAEEDSEISVSVEDLFCLKEARNIAKQNLNSLLEKFPLISTPSARDLPPNLFNLIVDMLMPSDAERERSLTGRKISHLAICGALTIGNTDDFNASRDLFELLHIYPQLQKTDNWENYLELLSHVVIKKNLFRKNIPTDAQPDEQWHVGTLLPGPSGADGQKRWYYNEAFSDDDCGNVNYLFLPACSRYEYNGKALPMIKAYRSTASNVNQVNYLESYVADMNPYSSPNSVDPDNAYAYEKKFFDERTIPTWVGYLLLGDKEENPLMYQKALEEYLFCLHAPGHAPQNKIDCACELNERKNAEKIREFLFNEASFHKELPEFKIAQDIFFTGHSLGGGLSQFAAYYFGPRRSRIPLPNQTLYCFASRAPAIDTYQDTVFMNFGRKHKELISKLNSSPWTVRQDLEYGDFVPEGGQSHLGTTNYDEDEDAAWLKTHFTVFHPLETAKDLAITTMPTHSRRMGNALEGRDFSIKSISPQDLSSFDHSWLMTAETISTFGFRILRSTKIAEMVRDIASKMLYPLWLLILRIHEALWPPIGTRDANGVWYLQYTPSKTE